MIIFLFSDKKKVIFDQTGSTQNTDFSKFGFLFTHPHTGAEVESKSHQFFTPPIFHCERWSAGYLITVYRDIMHLQRPQLLEKRGIFLRSVGIAMNGRYFEE